jgi:hypothetical protein
LVKEEPTNDEFTAEVQNAKDKAALKKKQPDLAKPSVQAVKVEENLQDIHVINADIANGVEIEDIQEDARETGKRASELADKLRKKDPEKSKVYRNLSIKASQRSYNPTGVSRGKGPIGQGNKAQRRLGKEPVPTPMSSDRMRGYSEEVDIQERSLTEPEMKKKEEIVKGMKKNLAGFKDRYGDRAKEVMYATSTQMAKKDN